MSQENIEQLLLKAAELPNNANLNAVYKAFEADPDSVKNSKDALIRCTQKTAAYFKEE